MREEATSDKRQAASNELEPRTAARYYLNMRKALLVALLVTPIAVVQTQSNDALLERARKLHKEVPLIDGHNDYPWELRQKAKRDFRNLDISKPQPSVMTDIARLRAGGVGGQFWSVYVPAELAGQAAVTATLEP